jgi:prophage maintenance system killer protein
LGDVERVGAGADPKEDILDKTSRLVFGVSRGQYFHEGNKRTALVACLSFLQMNGFTADIENPDLVDMVDRAGISTASLNDVREVLGRLVRNV